MYFARVRDSHEVLVTIAISEHSLHEIVAHVVPPSHVERSTGTLRSPEFTVDVPAQLAAELAGVEPAAVAGPVIGLLVHAMSRRALAIGVFTGADVAESWWRQPYNKLAKNPDVLFLTVPVVDGSSS